MWSTRGGLTSEAKTALDKAGKLIRETHYNRRLPDLALVSAELALARGDVAAAKAHLAAVIETMRANDLWGFMGDLARLAARYPDSGLDAELPALEAARAAFDREADAAFAEARKVRREDGLDDDVIDARLADPEFRANLVSLMEASDMPALDTVPVDQQREYARAFILQVERKQQPKPASGRAIDPSAIPDEPIDHMLTEDRAMLAKALADHGHDLDQLSPADQREAARQLIAAILAQQAKPGPPAEPPAAPTAAPPPTSPPQPKRSGIVSRLWGRFMGRP